MSKRTPSSRNSEHSKQNKRILLFGFGLLIVVMAFITLPSLIAVLG